MNQQQLEGEATSFILALAPPHGKGTLRLDDLNLSQNRRILAYEMWKDGMDWNDVQEILSSNNPAFPDKKAIMDQLVNVFGY